MINRVVLVGRLTKEPEVRKTQSGLSTCRFTLACDRRFAKKDDEQTADFINCVAWRQSADFLGNYANKGNIVGVEGRITTGSYEGEHGRVYTTDVTCDSVQLIGNIKKEDTKGTEEEVRPTYNQHTDFDGPVKMNELVNSDDLPFY